MEPDTEDCKLQNSYDVQSCVLAAVSILIGTVACFYGKGNKSYKQLAYINFWWFVWFVSSFLSSSSSRFSCLVKYLFETGIILRCGKS